MNLFLFLEGSSQVTDITNRNSGSNSIFNKVIPTVLLPKTGIEPISKSYKEFVLPIKLFRLIIITNKKQNFCVL